MKVDFVTCCYWKDAPKIHKEEVLKHILQGHQYEFNKVILIHQNCKKVEGLREIAEVPNLVIYDTADDPNILTEFGLPENDPDADFWTHGPAHPHYWKHHVINHLTALKHSDADYVVFADSDVTMVKNGPPSWITVGIQCLQKYRDVLIVSPDEGGQERDQVVLEGRKVRTISQQIFLCERQRFVQANLNIPFDSSALYEDPKKRKSTKLAPYGPLQEFYFMLEGRIWRWCDNQNLYRLLLNPNWRYWHWQGKIGGQ